MIQSGASVCYRIGKNSFWLIFSTFNHWTVTGREHVPRTGPVLLIANHTSYADPPIVGAACPRAVHFMAKQELFFFPLGPIIRSVHSFPVRRGEADTAALRKAVRMLKEGKVLLIFPEGGRSPDGKLMEFEHGAAFVALASGAAVVPIGIDGADRLLPRHSALVRPAKLRVRFGPPVALGDLRGGRVSREAIAEAAGRMYAALRGVLPEERWPAQ
jgi:1-acyl-sn-glycerol-3-phosphate acyltransferase